MQFRSCKTITVVAGVAICFVAIAALFMHNKRPKTRRIPIYNFEEKTHQLDDHSFYTTIMIELGESMSYEKVETIKEEFEAFFNSLSDLPDLPDLSDLPDLPVKLYRELMDSCHRASSDPNSYYQVLDFYQDRIKFYPIWDTTAKCVLMANTPYAKTNNAFKTVERIVIIDTAGYARIKERNVKENR